MGDADNAIHACEPIERSIRRTGLRPAIDVAQRSIVQLAVGPAERRSNGQYGPEPPADIRAAEVWILDRRRTSVSP